MSRGGRFFVNSPQSSQGLSPKEIIKQQRPVAWNEGGDEASPALTNSPALSAPSEDLSVEHK